MQHVPLKWLKLLRLTFGLYSLFFIVGFTLTKILGMTELQESAGFGIEHTIVAMLYLIYEISAGWYTFRRNPWTATVVGLGTVTLISFLVVEQTGIYSSPYWIALLTIVFLSGALGPYVAPALIFIFVVGYLFSVAGVFQGETNSRLALFELLVSIIIAGCNRFVWKRHYIVQDPEDRQLDKMLKDKQLQSEILLQSISDGVIVTNTDGKITLMNPAAARLTAWGIAEANAIDVRAVLNLTGEDGKPLDTDVFAEVLARRQHIGRYVTLTDQKKQTHIVSLVLSPVLIPNTQEMMGAVAVLRDVSRQRREEQQRAEFVSTASHEMRTPVAAIEGYLALAMNDKVCDIDSRARDYLEKAHASTQHLGNLFQDLLTSAKAEDSRLVNHPSVVEMGAFVEQNGDSFRFATEKKGLALDIIIGGTNATNGRVVKPLYYVWVDPDRLQEVLTNLFDNAVKYTESGKISIGLTGNQQVVQLFIRDTGAGIPAEDVPHLFQKFYRVDSSATRTIGGTGLGLFICRKIVELYKGRIWVESELSKGSTFYINLPRLDATQAGQLKSGQLLAAPMPTGAAQPVARPTQAVFGSTN